MLWTLTSDISTAKTNRMTYSTCKMYYASDKIWWESSTTCSRKHSVRPKTWSQNALKTASGAECKVKIVLRLTTSTAVNTAQHCIIILITLFVAFQTQTADRNWFWRLLCQQVQINVTSYIFHKSIDRSIEIPLMHYVYDTMQHTENYSYQPNDTDTHTCINLQKTIILSTKQLILKCYSSKWTEKKNSTVKE